MTLEHHTTFASVRDQWDELAERVDAPPFLRAGWFETWWAAFGRGSLDIAALRTDGRLAAVLPLSRRFGVLRSLTNWHQPEYGVVAESAAARAALTEELLGASRAPIALRFVDDEGPDKRALWAATQSAGGRLQTRVQLSSPYVEIGGEWDDYLARRDTRFVRTIRRRQRRLGEQGNVQVRVEDRWEQLDDALAVGFLLEGSGWKTGAGTAISSSAATATFYTEIARWAAEKRWLRMAALDVDGAPVAWELLLEHGGVMFGLKGGYDATYRTFGPGVLLRREILSHCFAHGISRLDFLGGASSDKLAWTHDARAMTAIDFFPRSTAGAVGLASYTYGRPIAKRARAYAADGHAPWRRLGERRGTRA